MADTMIESEQRQLYFRNRREFEFKHDYSQNPWIIIVVTIFKSKM